MSTASVLAGLKATPKGRLSYGSPWETLSSAERHKFLSSITSPPALSPEALNYLCEKMRRASLAQAGSPSSCREQERGGTDGGGRDRTPGGVPSAAAEGRSDSTVGPTPGRDETSFVCTDQPSFDLTDLGSDVAAPPKTPSDAGFVSVLEERSREVEERERRLDDQLMREVEEAVRFRRELFCGELERRRRAEEEGHRREREARERRRELQRGKEQAEAVQWKQKILHKMNALLESYQEHDELLEAKLRFGEERKIEILRKHEQKKREARLRLVELCRGSRGQVLDMKMSLESSLKSCSYPHLLSRSAVDLFTATVQQLDALQIVFSRLEHSSQPEQTEFESARSQLAALSSSLAELRAAVEEASREGERELRRRKESEEREKQRLAEEAEKIKQQQQQLQQQQQQQQSQKSSAPPPSTSAATGGHSPSDMGMPRSMLKVYDRLQQNMDAVITAYDSLAASRDASLKRLRFDLQKAVSTPVNAISVQSGEHLLDKIQRLLKLLSGHRVEVTGKSLSVSQHPGAKMYCCNLLAKKLVKQGEEQVASQKDAAFPVAAVAVGVWSEFAELGDLLLFHLYTSCPSLVPFNARKREGMSDTEHMRLEGYRISEDGTAESEDIFLKRVSGVVRLYAAILQTPPFSAKPHPHGLENGWAWLARVLNMEPHPLLTATALYCFLEVAGHALLKKYGRQFRKLLQLLCTDYVHKIEAVTPPAQQGPLSRLKLFLEECVSTGRIVEPKGCLTQAFWRTRSHGIAVA